MASENEKQSPPPVEKDEGKETSGTAVATPRERPAPGKREPGRLPPYKVLLHNDDKNTMDHVVRSILGLTTLREEDAVQRTIEAHKTGVALLLVTHKERAELYQEQFASFSLTVTIEPDA
jgi:ATP-dependent Clp protease adaptor protein ClpS